MSLNEVEALKAEIERLKTTNRNLHRRVQKCEAPTQAYEDQRKHLEQLALQMYRGKVQDFDRMIKAHREIYLIFLELSRAYPYPQSGRHMHSTMDCRGTGDTKAEGIWANCYTLPSGIKSYRVLDEVRTAVDELLLLREKSSPTLDMDALVERGAQAAADVIAKRHGHKHNDWLNDERREETRAVIAAILNKE